MICSFQEQDVFYKLFETKELIKGGIHSHRVFFDGNEYLLFGGSLWENRKPKWNNGELLNFFLNFEKKIFDHLRLSSIFLLSKNNFIKAIEDQSNKVVFEQIGLVTTPLPLILTGHEIFFRKKKKKSVIFGGYPIFQEINAIQMKGKELLSMDFSFDNDKSAFETIGYFNLIYDDENDVFFILGGIKDNFSNYCYFSDCSKNDEDGVMTLYDFKIKGISDLERRCESVVHFIDAKMKEIIVFGGSVVSNVEDPFSGTIFNDIHIINIENKTCRLISAANPPVGVRSPGSCIVDDCLFIFGGVTRCCYIPNKLYEVSKDLVSTISLIFNFFRYAWICVLFHGLKLIIMVKFLILSLFALF